ncbi:hypothetical protein ACFL0I_01600 [Gemmatimonadota bacterium]
MPCGPLWSMISQPSPGESSRRGRTRPTPPHIRIANVVVSSPDAEEAAREAERGAAWVLRALRGKGPRGMEVVGPAPSPIEKLHGRWRWHFLLRGPSSSSLGTVLQSFQAGFRARGGEVRVVVDRDPVALL